MLLVFRTNNSPLQIYFLELHIDATIIEQQQQKNVVGKSFFVPKTTRENPNFWG